MWFVIANMIEFTSVWILTGSNAYWNMDTGWKILAWLYIHTDHISYILVSIYMCINERIFKTLLLSTLGSLNNTRNVYFTDPCNKRLDTRIAIHLVHNFCLSKKKRVWNSLMIREHQSQSCMIYISDTKMYYRVKMKTVITLCHYTLILLPQTMSRTVNRF